MLPPVLERLPIETVRCYFEPDGTFPNHEPNPLLPENREFVMTKTREEQADLGVAYDGDADRCFFVDDTGEFVPGDFVTALLAESILAKEGGGKVIYDVRASWAVPETIERAGGMPLVNRVGHAYIKHRMRKEDAVFGGEVSAHYYFRDFSQADSGVVPFLLLLELISTRGQKLSEILAPYRERFFLTGEINTPVADVAAEAAGDQGALRGRSRQPSGRDLGRLRRLALQRPALEHRAAPAPQPRGPLAGADGAEARRGARADPVVSPRARPRHRPEAALQVLGDRTRLVLGHRCPGRRLLRPLPPLLRPRPHRVPPPPRRRGDLARRPRLRHARVGRRVPRACRLRRSARDLRPHGPDRPDEHDVRVRRLPDGGRPADGDGDRRRSCSSTSTSGVRPRSRRPTAS